MSLSQLNYIVENYKNKLREWKTKLEATKWTPPYHYLTYSVFSLAALVNVLIWQL